MLIVVPAGILEPVPGRTEKIEYIGLQDSDDTAVIATVEGNDIRIRGFDTYDPGVDGNIEVTFFLKNLQAADFEFTVQLYDSGDNLAYQSDVFTQLTIVDTPESPFYSGEFVSYLTDSLPVFASETWPFKFTANVKNALTFANGGEIIFTKPTAWTITNEICRYSLDDGDTWIRSACSFTGDDLHIPITQNFDLPTATDILFEVTTQNFDDVEFGFFRDSAADMYTIHFWTEESAAVQESVYEELILLPVPVLGNANNYVYFYTEGRNDYTVIEVSIEADATWTADDDFRIDFYQYNRLGYIFRPDMG